MKFIQNKMEAFSRLKFLLGKIKTWLEQGLVMSQTDFNQLKKSLKY